MGTHSATAAADILPGFTQETNPLRPDEEDGLVATLVRSDPRAETGKAVLYLQGYVDYFFHVELAARYAQLGSLSSQRRTGREPGPDITVDVRVSLRVPVVATCAEYRARAPSHARFHAGSALRAGERDSSDRKGDQGS